MPERYIYIYLHMTFLRLFFGAVLGSEQNKEEGIDFSHIPSAPTRAQPPPLSPFPIGAVRLLQLISLLSF